MLIVVVMDPGPRLGQFMFGHAGGRCVFGRHGTTQDLAQRGVGRSGRESVMGSRLVLSECRWSTRMGVRGHGFRGVGTVGKCSMQFQKKSYAHAGSI